MTTPVQLSRGEKRKLTDLGASQTLSVTFDAGLPGADVSVFGLDGDRKLRNDTYFVFYNQPRSPHGEITTDAQPSSAHASFTLDLAQLPPTVTRLMFVATHDDTPFSRAGTGTWSLRSNGQELARYAYQGADFQAEKAVMVAEVYQHAGEWRVAAVGQGFNGGLDALLVSFGGEVAADAPAPPTPAPAPTAPVDLKKQARVRLDKEIQHSAPQLVSLVKQAQVSLQKKGLDEHTARMALVLDISGSMQGLYANGTVQRVVEKALALGSRFDDDGRIDVFLFGVNAQYAGEVSVRDVTGYVNRLMRTTRLEGGTQYGKAMQLLRRHYFGDAVKRKQPFEQSLPVYVMFVTDGETQGQDVAVQQLMDGSYEPLFYKFLGVGHERFQFLQRLDDLRGRLIDNADFVAVNDIDRVGDAELYDRLVQEYPEFLRSAKAHRMLPQGLR
ncbi:VWA domain-containing protein [Deinococcus peraridilitoris]|uniref:Putative stress response protein, TerZ-and CABP1 n=1 Tax=Deinococcus peraridilitoris (strain DSM 19664 / LMG 22246 / CIP 109416 / KR-200) TaxID=937777 RepID=L0A0F2_DEIPD|nr:VWA domain-containing protein [Deinococcus peraridilitoris]AFZ66939.1 putative stress response protein, TerZ- and CABP1 [Deinococcus peraridilitoris DSM 19664]